MTRSKLLALLFLCTGVSALAGVRSPLQRLHSYLSSPSERGSIFAQATLDGVDYRNILRGAVSKDSHSLSEIFRYTANGKLMGEGSESNCDILYQLLHLWGDSSFAHVLAKEPSHIRAAVINSLDYAWPRPGWKSREFSATYSLAKHDAHFHQ